MGRGADTTEELNVEAAARDASVRGALSNDEMKTIRHKAMTGGPGTMVMDSEPYREFDEGRIRVWGYSYDSAAVEQIRNVASRGWVEQAALMGDSHLGYSMPIGGVAAYREMISPSGVGYDIGCGVHAVETNILFSDIEADLERITDEIASQLNFGLGGSNAAKSDHALFDSETWNDVPYLTQEFKNKRGSFTLRDRARQQLGTIGSGNHYADLLVDSKTGKVWIACHFGSRGFGHGIASGFLRLAKDKPFEPHSETGEQMMALPSLFPLTEAAAKELNGPNVDPSWAIEQGQMYKRAMELAGEYAYAGREHVAGQMLAILGATAEESVHTHHNFSWTEDVGGESFEVVRKGATPAYPGQTGFIGGSMGDISVIVRGVDTENAATALHSTVHGAGRVMSRSRAGGNRKGTRPGEISTDMMFGALANFRKESGLPLTIRGGGVDESPFVYRKLEPVLAAHVETDTIEVTHKLVPVSVCMAGADIVDPFKD